MSVLTVSLFLATAIVAGVGIVSAAFVIGAVTHPIIGLLAFAVLFVVAHAPLRLLADWRAEADLFRGGRW